MAVFGTAQALRDVEELARSRKGYLVKRSDSSITIRVPAALFDETLEGVSGLGDELHRDVSARDVTKSSPISRSDSATRRSCASGSKRCSPKPAAWKMRSPSSASSRA
jgi:hypothetical protein